MFKLGLFSLVCTFAFISWSQENDSIRERECLRNRKLGGDEYNVKNYKLASTYYLRGESYCGDQYDVKQYSLLLASLQNVLNVETDPTAKSAYIDTIIGVYDRAKAKNVLPANSELIWGLYELQSSKLNREKVDKVLGIGIRSGSKMLRDAYLFYYYQNLYVLYANSTGDAKLGYKKRMISEYFEINKLASEVGASAENIENINKLFNDCVKSCDDMLPELKSFISVLPQDLESKKVTVNNFISLLEKKGCDKSKEYEMLIDTLIKIDPSVSAVIGKGKLLKSKNKYSDAIETFRKAKSMTSDQNQIEEIEYMIASSQFEQGSYASAYSTAMGISGKYRNDALKIAAQCVYNNANNCGTSTFERKCNYYYAADLADRAGASSLSSKAKSQFPSTDEIFSEGKSKGQSVSLSCWGVSVTIK
jgi:tetratricopeptide (TPR) repeat protein